MSPKCALPKHIDEPHEWEGTDDTKVWWMRWRLYCKWLFAFSNRCSRGLAFAVFPPFIVLRKWRKWPITLWAVRGEGAWRFENFKEDSYSGERIIFWRNPETNGDSLRYLSRVQYWCRWHFAIQWPLQVTFHFYPKAKDVPIVGTREQTDGELWFLYFPTHIDSDEVHWFPSAFFGCVWK